jgi:hypothetical protein
MINDIAPPKKRRDPTPKRLEEPLETDETSQEVFRTPEQIAQEHQGDLLENVKNLSDEELPPQPPRKRFAWRPNRWQTIIGIVIAILLISGAGAGWWYTHRPKPVVKAQKTVVAKPKVVVPTTVPSTLTGLPVDPAVNAVPVTGVMIENSTFARPQSGLKDAGVVFEAIAEGGITRFLALYQDTAPTNVGPIRSVRPYYEQWALGFNASLAHVGGSPEALADMKTWGVRDLDQFANGGYYHRIATREAPHNVYTGIPTLNQLEAKKGFTTSNYTGFARKAAAPLKVPTAKTISLAISGPDYNVTYAYNATTNSYLRNLAGAPHLDANSGTQITPQVVVAMVIPYSLEADGYHSSYGVIGSGPVYIFQDGGVTTGQWSKSSNTTQLTFTDANGAPITLNPGQTWLTAVANTSKVSYAP